MSQNLIGLFNGLILLQLTKVIAPTQPFLGVPGGMMTNAKNVWVGGYQSNCFGFRSNNRF